MKASCAKLKYQKILYQRKVVNRHDKFFAMKEIALKFEVLPSKNDVEQFWSEIWGNKCNFNHNSERLKLLEKSYCPNVIEKDYSIRTDTVKKAIQKLQLKKSPGPDLINGLWYKKPSSFISFVANFMANHLQIHKNRNDYVNYVYQLEESQSIRVGK